MKTAAVEKKTLNERINGIDFTYDGISELKEIRKEIAEMWQEYKKKHHLDAFSQKNVNTCDIFLELTGVAIENLTSDEYAERRHHFPPFTEKGLFFSLNHGLGTFYREILLSRKRNFENVYTDFHNERTFTNWIDAVLTGQHKIRMRKIDPEMENFIRERRVNEYGEEVINPFGWIVEKALEGWE